MFVSEYFFQDDITSVWVRGLGFGVRGLGFRVGVRDGQ